MTKSNGISNEPKLIIRQGHQIWHAHQALKKHDEASYICELAMQYHNAGRVGSIAEGMVLAGALITAYRSNEAGERVPQLAREKLDAKVAECDSIEAMPGCMGA